MTKKQTPWTRFMDMHSGGELKEKWQYIYIEAPQAEAEVIFYNRFGHNPHRVSCTCCGSDYSIAESPSLEQATGYDRNCHYAYMDTKGREVPQEKAWVRGKGMRRGYTQSYVERGRESKWGTNGGYKTLDAYKRAAKRGKISAHFIYAKNIKPEERTGTLPDQGYVWID